MSKGKFVSSVGLDLGAHSVKCVEVAQNADQFELRRVSILPCQGVSQEDMKKLLKILFDPYQGQPPHLRISVSSGSSLLIRRIKLPLMTAAELKGAIIYEAEGHIPFPIEDCLLDFQIINQNSAEKTMNVMLVAAKKDFIHSRLKLLQDLNVIPEIIDVDIFCLLNAFEVLGEDGGQKCYGVLNIGHGMSSFAIIDEKQPFFVREIPLGGKDVTRAIMEIKGISEEEADRIKNEQPAQQAADLKLSTLRGFETLVEELKHSIDFFENETGEELKQIWMSGGGARSFMASEILAEELGRQVTIWDNLKKMAIFGEVDQKFLSEHALELNVALGMVLRSAEKKK